MEQLKFTTIAHQGHTFFSPLSSAKADRLVALLQPALQRPVLDIGCGRAELLIRTCEHYGVNGIGVDINQAFLDQAAATAAKRLEPGQLLLVNQPMAEYPVPPLSLGGVICMGSLHAYGDYAATLERCKAMVVGGGFVLIGEGYWKQPPAPEYLKFLGASPADYGSHADTMALGESLGLLPLYSTTSNDDEWDHYEGLYSTAIERYVAAHPHDPDAPAMRERIRAWRTMYLQHGRACLGFGFYLFQKP